MSATEPTLIIEAMTPDVWDRFRAVRLAALEEAPRAFGSTLDRELAFDEAEWRRRTGNGALAVRDGHDVGLVGCMHFDEEPPGTWTLVAMWVAPEARGTGAGKALVAWALEHARSGGADRVVLWVATWNDAAIRLYRRCGFEATGREGPLPSHPDVWELEMAVEV